MSLVSLDDYETAAIKKIPKAALEYYRGGAGNELTLQLNRTAFDRIRIRPRVLRDVSKRDLSITILGLELRMPISVAPFAMQRVAHPDGEVANAKAAGNLGVVFTLPTMATTSIEDVAQQAPNTIKWAQFFIYKDKQLTQHMVERAEKAGFNGIVITVDCAVFGLRRANMRNKFNLPHDTALANFTGEDAVGVKLQGEEATKVYAVGQFTWEDVKWVKGISKLPVILKGIYTAEDAIIAADLCVDAIIVSNHGGRQLDSTTAPLEALPEIAKAVGHRLPIIMDGGVRQGTDVFKALALGASMVMIGRPALWGLAVDGQKGVENVLEILRMELDTAMSLAGCARIGDISKDMVAHESTYSKL